MTKKQIEYEQKHITPYDYGSPELILLDLYNQGWTCAASGDRLGMIFVRPKQPGSPTAVTAVQGMSPNPVVAKPSTGQKLELQV